MGANCEFGISTIICSVEGERYWILVTGEEGDAGEFALTVRDTDISCRQPFNSLCSRAFPVRLDERLSIVHKDYPPSRFTDCRTLNPSGSPMRWSNVAWYTFEAASDQQYFVDLCDSLQKRVSFDVQVYQGDKCEDAHCFGLSEDVNNRCADNEEYWSSTDAYEYYNSITKRFCAQAGQRYYIALFDGYGKNTCSCLDPQPCSKSCAQSSPKSSSKSRSISSAQSCAHTCAS